MDSPQSLPNDVEGLSVPLGLDQVRLLKIVSGADDKPVSCLLQTFSIGSCYIHSLVLLLWKSIDY
jgi:hypothetical protein